MEINIKAINKYYMNLEAKANPLKYGKSIKYMTDPEAFCDVTAQLNINQARNLRKILMQFNENLSKKVMNQAERIKQMNFLEGITNAVEQQSKINVEDARLRRYSRSRGEDAAETRFKRASKASYSNKAGERFDCAA